MFLTHSLRDKLSHKGNPIRLEKNDRRTWREYFVSLSQVIHEEDDTSKKCKHYPNKDYKSYAECDSIFVKNAYQAAFQTEDCEVSYKEDITPIFATKNLSEVPNFVIANCTISVPYLGGILSGTNASPCFTPCNETQTYSVLTSVKNADKSEIISIVFDRRVMITNVTLDRFHLMESLNFFGSNLGLWPGLGIFQITKWLFENIVLKLNIANLLEFIRKKISKPE